MRLSRNGRSGVSAERRHSHLFEKMASVCRPPLQREGWPLKEKAKGGLISSRPPYAEEKAA